MEIKETILQIVVGLFQGGSHVVARLLNGFKEYLLSFEVSDIFGFILIIIALLMITTRARYQLIVHYSDINNCPFCEGDLRHIHRTTGQRLLSFFLRIKIRRYRCKECGEVSVRMKPQRRGKHHS